jgi:thiopurine S-methyltransferase
VIMGDDGRDFWAELWRTGRTGFHRPDPHPDLVAHHDQVIGDAARVLVPLCGRTPDLAWLAERHREVVGVEFVAEAVEQYAREHDLAPAAPVGSLTAYRGGPLTLLLGDFFAVPADAGPFDAIWDRAALVALDAATRPRYVAACRALLRPGAPVLLSTFRFDQPADVGPPFSIDDDELRRLYRGAEVVPLATDDPTSPRRLYVVR